MSKKIMTSGKTSESKEHFIGPISVAAFILLYDVIAIKKGKSTISKNIRKLTSRGFGPEIAGAIVGMLAFHLFLKD